MRPDLAPNTASSFIWLAARGAFDGHRIARVEPGYVVDVSTNAFGREICRYLIANEAPKTFPAIKPDLGTIAMGGYGGNIAGGEFFFPLAPSEKLDGKYPVFGTVTGGWQEIERIGRGSVRPFRYNHNANNPMRAPVSDEIIMSVAVETFGVSYPEPERLNGVGLPAHWFIENYDALI